MPKRVKSDPAPSPTPQVEDVAATEPPDATPPPPPPEPWTASRVLEWNAYYDIYVAVGVVLLTFLVASTRLTHSSLWTQLETGRVISSTGTFGQTDLFSYTAQGQHWVNIPWLTDVIHYQVFRLVSSFAPIDPDNLPAQMAKAEQWGAAGLIALTALIRGLTAFILLQIRRKGPGLWWSSICVILAFCAAVTPLGLIMGGIAGRAVVSSEVWGNLLLALELWLVHRALFLGKGKSLYAVVPILWLWANMHESFIAGVLILLATVIGLVVKKKPSKTAEAEGGPSLRQGLIVLGLAIVATCINPSLYRVYPASMASVIPGLGWVVGPITADQRSVFSAPLNAADEDEVRQLKVLQAYFLILVGIGLGSFVLNLRRFNLSRFLIFAVGAVLWAVMFRWQAEFGIILAMTLAQNGQEWYQDQFGTEGRLGTPWAIWSTGGRALTLVAVVILALRTFTGQGSFYGEAVFGYGFNPDDFPFDTAEFVASAPLEGTLLNTTFAQGDTIIWRS